MRTGAGRSMLTTGGRRRRARRQGWLELGGALVPGAVVDSGALVVGPMSPGGAVVVRGRLVGLCVAPWRRSAVNGFLGCSRVGAVGDQDGGEHGGDRCAGRGAGGMRV